MPLVKENKGDRQWSFGKIKVEESLVASECKGAHIWSSDSIESSSFLSAITYTVKLGSCADVSLVLTLSSLVKSDL